MFAFFDPNISLSVSITCGLIGVIMFLFALDYVLEDRKRRKLDKIIERYVQQDEEKKWRQQHTGRTQKKA